MMSSRQTSLKLSNVPRSLRREWWFATFVCGCMVLCGCTLINYGFPDLNKLQWILQTVIVAVYVLGQLRYGLVLNYASQRDIRYSNLGYGTWITIIRAMLVATLAGFLFQPWPQSSVFPGSLSWVPGIIYITASILDFADGQVARHYKCETHLGAFLDTKFDALGLLIAPLLAVWYGQLPLAYLTVSAAYYVFIIGIRLRKKYSKLVVELEPRSSARIVAGFQMGLVGAALLPLFSPPVTTIAAYIFMVPLLAGFVKDWSYVCGYPKRYLSLKSSKKRL